MMFMFGGSYLLELLVQYKTVHLQKGLIEYRNYGVLKLNYEISCKRFGDSSGNSGNLSRFKFGEE